MSIYVSDAVWEHSQQSGSALTVLLALARHANDQGYCFPSLAKLMAETRLSERAVRMHLRGLEEAGEIKTEQGRGRGNVNVYWIIVGPYAQRGEKGQNPAEKGQPAATKGAIQRGEKGQNPAEKGQNPAEKGQTFAPRTVKLEPSDLEPSVEPSESVTPPTKRRRALPAEPSVSAEFVERMSEKYADSLPRATIAEEIHAALSHKNAKKWTNTELYVQRWLNREVERHQANAQAPPSQNRRRPTQQSPPKDPRSSLQGPYSHLIKH